MSLDRHLDAGFATLAAGVCAFNADPDPVHALAALTKVLVDVKITAALGGS